MDTINISDIRAFINGIEQAFYDKEKELNPAVRYSILKGVVSLRIKETKLMKVFKSNK